MPEQDENTPDVEQVEDTEGQAPEVADASDATGAPADADTTRDGKPDLIGGTAFDDLPPETQKEIRKLRAEAANARTQAKEKAAAEARKQAEAEAQAALDAERAANAERLKRIARELGLVEDEKAELTPEQMVEKITAERDQERQAREERDKRFRELALEVAVQDAAAMHEGRADRLLDSRSFMRKVRDLDPDSDGYRAAVADAVKAAVEADDDLRAQKKNTPPPVSGGTTVAGKAPKKPEDMTVQEFEELLHKRR